MVRSVSDPAGPVVGLVGCQWHDGPGWNLGYRFARSAWGRGLAAEAVTAALAAAGEVAPELPVVAYLLEHNTGSRRAAARAWSCSGGVPTWATRTRWRSGSCTRTVPCRPGCWPRSPTTRDGAESSVTGPGVSGAGGCADSHLLLSSSRVTRRAMSSTAAVVRLL